PNWASARCGPRACRLLSPGHWSSVVWGPWWVCLVSCFGSTFLWSSLFELWFARVRHLPCGVDGPRIKAHCATGVTAPGHATRRLLTLAVQKARDGNNRGGKLCTTCPARKGGIYQERTAHFVPDDLRC